MNTVLFIIIILCYYFGRKLARRDGTKGLVLPTTNGPCSFYRDAWGVVQEETWRMVVK